MAKKPIQSKSAPSEQVINLDKLTPEELEKKVAKYNKLPASTKVLIKGKIQTIGKLKATQSNKERTSKKMLKSLQGKVVKELNKRKKQLDIAEKKELAKKFKNIKKIQSIARKNKASSFKFLGLKVSKSILATRASTTDPVIEGLNVDHGKPGEPILIIGRNFGPGIDARYGSKVNLKVPGDETIFPICTAWDDELIEFYIPPDISGISESYHGEISVVRRNCDTPSNSVQFLIDPYIETIVLAAHPSEVQEGAYWSISHDIVEISPFFENSSDSAASSCYIREGSGTHFLGSPVTNLISINRCIGDMDLWPGWWSDCEGSVTFFEGFQLTNNYWKIEEMRLIPTTNHGNERIQLGSYNRGGTSLEVNVTYNVESNHRIVQIIIYISGPRGVPFKIRKP